MIDFQILDNSVIADLSWDQRLLYNYCQTVLTGSCSADLAHLEPGPVFHSNWLMLWARIVRLNMSTWRPSSKLKRLVPVIVKCSSPMWFVIKCNQSITNGTRQVFKELCKAVTQPYSYRVKIARNVVQGIAYFAYHECWHQSTCKKWSSLTYP